jgi:hypothetical protein
VGERASFVLALFFPVLTRLGSATGELLFSVEEIVKSKRSKALHISSALYAGLPDGMFACRKLQIWYISEVLIMKIEICGKFFGNLVFYGNLVYFIHILVCFTNKNQLCSDIVVEALKKLLI